MKLNLDSSVACHWRIASIFGIVDGMKPMTRRRMLARLGCATGAIVSVPAVSALTASPADRQFPIGACDWSLGKKADLGALEAAQAIGLDGVQVSLGTVEDGMHLRRKEVQARYQKAVQQTGVSIASLAIGELNRVPYKSDPRTIEWVADSIDAAKALGCRVVLLAFFGNGDIKDDPKGRNEVVRRLKDVAPKAEEAGVILGIESWLSADEHLDLIQRVGSRAVQVYYDIANSNKMGYDIYDEIRRLGDKQICEMHMKENGALLGEGKIHFRQLRRAIDDAGYTGWLVIEGARPGGVSLVEAYTANRKCLERHF